ncbi:MAG: hypothetical protein ACYSYL_20335 [Planctomycetota bacterium]|jgi:prepilin-type processing-associated H-X9-DG protein
MDKRHGDGTTFSFADGHVEYWKWEDPRTVPWGLKMKSCFDPLDATGQSGYYQNHDWRLGPVRLLYGIQHNHSHKPIRCAL